MFAGSPLKFWQCFVAFDFHLFFHCTFYRVIDKLTDCHFVCSVFFSVDRSRRYKQIGPRSVAEWTRRTEGIVDIVLQRMWRDRGSTPSFFCIDPQSHWKPLCSIYQWPYVGNESTELSPTISRQCASRRVHAMQCTQWLRDIYVIASRSHFK